MTRRMERGRWALAVAMALAIVAAVPRPALAAVQVTLASADPRGGGSDRIVELWTTLSPDGRYAAFFTDGHDLVPGDDAGKQDDDVYLRDLQTQTTVKVSVDRNGNDTTGDSEIFPGAVSEGGRYVAFSSNARDLIADTDTQEHDFNVFVRDIVTGSTILVSPDRDGGDANGTSGGGAITPDGRYVVFSSTASDLVGGIDLNHTYDVFVRDLEAETTTRVSVDVDGGDAAGASGCGSISDDGRYVAFESAADDLVADDTDAFTDIFLRDLVTGTTQRLSVDPQGGGPNGYSTCPKISGEGRSVAFTSFASNLVVGDGNTVGDVFVRDVPAGTTLRASVDTQGEDANGSSFDPAISEDGRYVTFYTWTTDMFEGDANADWPEIAVRDLVAGVTIRITASLDGDGPDGWNLYPDISADGKTVIFQSGARDLVPGLERVTTRQALVATWS